MGVKKKNPPSLGGGGGGGVEEGCFVRTIEKQDVPFPGELTVAHWASAKPRRMKELRMRSNIFLMGITEGKVKKVELGEQPLDLVVQTQRQPEEHIRTKNGKLKMVGTNSSSTGGLTGHEGAPDSREGSESSRELRGNKGSNMGGHKIPVRSSTTERKCRIERSRREELTRGVDNGAQDEQST
ncbi:hypothetical protein SAY86_004004 [Trapa natans]|uniref:Uncharacterized protein n=1 Tax=Trapa natans TaxID=22666 RepID=A0AAN7MUH8_TRANT|nr:hypothetical protein SAY86_004004 [Trapa natans]